MTCAPRARRWTTGRRAGMPLLLLLPLLAACGGGEVPGDARILADLVRELPTAEVRREVRAIDVGTPEARRHLLEGWSWDESTPAAGAPDGTYAWGVGEASEVELFMAEPRPLELRLRGHPFVFDQAPPQTVRVEVNGSPLARLVLEGGTETLSVTLPERALRPGSNRLTLRYGWSRSPASLDLSDDRRPLATAWSGIRLDPVPPATGRVAAITGDDGPPRLEIPFGAGVDTFMEVPAPPGSRNLLAIDRLHSGGSVGSLVVEIQEEGAEPVRAAKIGPVGASGQRSLLRLPLRPSTPGAESENGGSRRLLRLGLRAVPEEPGESGGLVLTAPRVLTTAPPGEEHGGEKPAEDPEPITHGRPPHVLIYLVDTLRADRVGMVSAGDAGRSLTPRIDGFAEEATVYADAIAEAPWTRPTVASVLTGLPPLVHGVTTIHDRLADEAVTLPELFRDAGYRTVAFSTNWHVTEATGMAQGFGDFVFVPDAVHAADLNRHVLDRVDRVLSEGDERPLLLYVHALDPHAPYEPPERFRERLAPNAPPEAGSRPYLERIYSNAPGSPERTALMEPIPKLYDAEVAAVDEAFGALLDALEKRGLEQDMAVVFVSDHGEGLEEHGHLGHGHDLYGEAIRVPMIVRLPGKPPGRTEPTAQPSDLFGLLRGLLGLLEPPERADPSDAATPRAAFSHLDYEGRKGLSVVLGEWKAIEPLSGAFGRRAELYHRVRDPGERHDLAKRHPVRLGYLRTLIRRHLREVDDGTLAETTEIDIEARRGLEALGYL